MGLVLLIGKIITTAFIIAVEVAFVKEK